ncbi:MAG: LuxR C-terminal-related transcriptional regulator [Solirubrobacteraceae bacterium]
MAANPWTDRDGELPFLETKLAPPALRHGLVDRPRVQRALDVARDAALTIVTAPAGYGKTTAARVWCSHLNASLAWITLDAGDNDPVRLWRYVVSAVDRARPLGQAAMRRLKIPGGAVDGVVDELMNAISRLESELVIVLDEMQVVTNEDCFASIDRALDHLPVNAHILILTRMDPPLSLARLRASGALAEVRAADLAFTAAEAHALLVVLGHLELGSEEIEMLVEHTEGWPAALVLAWLWLRGADDPAQAVKAFGGQNRFVADYLSNEVLAALDEDSRAFLEGASVLGEFTAELCDAVLGRSDSAVRLGDLERSNLFVTRLEQGKWFRIHSLFADYASARLASRDPDEPGRIHRRAAKWLRSRGLRVAAIQHAAARGDDDLVAQILETDHLLLIREGSSQTLLRYVRTLPDDTLAQHLELSVAGATAAMLVGGHTLEQRRLLGIADRELGRRSPGAADYVEVAVSLVRAVTLDRGVAQAVCDGRRAVELASADVEEVITAALVSYSRALFFAGDLARASAMAMRALEHPSIEQATPSMVVARATLALIAIERGGLSAARAHADEAKVAVRRIGTSRSWLGANAAAALGLVLAVEGRLVEAEHELAAAERFFRDEVPTVHHTWLLVLLARVRIRRGHLADAETAMRVARHALVEIAGPGTVSALAEDVERELETVKGRARTGELLGPPSESEVAVLRLLATDLSTREIAERLFVSVNTVRSHRHALYQKLGVHSREDAVARAAALGVLTRRESPE